MKVLPTFQSCFLGHHGTHPLLRHHLGRCLNAALLKRWKAGFLERGRKRLVPLGGRDHKLLILFCQMHKNMPYQAEEQGT